MSNESSTFVGFTEEAIILIRNYLREVKQALKEVSLKDDEIEGSMSEFRNHIITHCKLKVPEGNVVTTEIANQSIEKLGQPNIIAQTLMSEFKVMKVVQDEMEIKNISDVEESVPSWTISIKAIHLWIIFQVLLWISTYVIAMQITFGGPDFVWNYEILNFYPIYYIFLVGFYNGLQYIGQKRDNVYLRSKSIINLHLVIPPVIFLIHLLLNNPYPAWRDFDFQNQEWVVDYFDISDSIILLSIGLVIYFSNSMVRKRLELYVRLILRRIPVFNL